MSARRTHEDFITELKEKNEAYRNGDFEIIGEYVTGTVPILLKDKYGYCEVRPTHLLNEGSKTSIKSAINKEEYLIEQFREKHALLYNYSKVKYKTQKTKVEIICKKHGSFWQTPDNHKKGHGCKECRTDGKILGREALIKRLRDFDKGYRYDVGENVKLMRDYINITCPNDHTYRQKAVEHLDGNGCPVCANISHSLSFEEGANKEDIHKIQRYVYFFKVYDKTEVFYKVGVTKDVKRRISELKKGVPYKIEVLGYERYSMFDCYNLERFIIEEFKNVSYRPKHNFTGYTECFRENIYHPYLDLMHENYYKNISYE